MEHGPIDMVAWILVIIGALNWGLVGIGGFMGQNLDLVQMLLGSIPMLRDIVYLLVGLSGLYLLIMHFKK